MNAPASTSGRELWAFLPAVYRDRDNGDLALYLDVCGELLDRVRATLDQRLADCFPKSPQGEPQAQAWLLPYFADLLDVRLLSPFVDGRRDEVALAISWRQAKGTLRTLEKLAESVGQFEVEVQEGWKRVAVTPRVDLALLPAAAFGEDVERNPKNPLEAARRPGLPVATVDLRLPSRAIQAAEDHPLSRTTKFAGKSLTWRQLNPTGAPCFPGSFEDASRRTVDLRTPTWKEGHFHPRQVLLFVAPPTGFFPPDQVTLPWAKRKTPEHQDHVTDLAGPPRRIWNPSLRAGSPIAPVAVTVTTQPPNFDEPAVEIEDLSFRKTLTVTGGRVVLRRVAARKVVVDTTDGEQPMLEAYDCLFDEIEAKNGLVLLDACTVMTSVTCRRLQASDCLFAGSVTVTPLAGDATGCVRYSRIPEDFALKPRLRTTTAEPAFFTLDVCDPTVPAPGLRTAEFGDPGYGVLHPATPDAIAFGAEDGGEMGAGHHRRFRLAWAAVTAKVEEFLPVGMAAVLIPDPRLLVAPPEPRVTSKEPR